MNINIQEHAFRRYRQGINMRTPQKGGLRLGPDVITDVWPVVVPNPHDKVLKQAAHSWGARITYPKRRLQKALIDQGDRTLVQIIGPGCAGKTTHAELARLVYGVGTLPEVKTRPTRPGEKFHSGRDAHGKPIPALDVELISYTEEEFWAAVDADEFFYAHVFGLNSERVHLAGIRYVDLKAAILTQRPFTMIVNILVAAYFTQVFEWMPIISLHPSPEDHARYREMRNMPKGDCIDQGMGGITVHVREKLRMSGNIVLRNPYIPDVKDHDDLIEKLKERLHTPFPLPDSDQTMYQSLRRTLLRLEESHEEW